MAKRSFYRYLGWIRAGTDPLGSGDVDQFALGGQPAVGDVTTESIGPFGGADRIETAIDVV